MLRVLHQMGEHSVQVPSWYRSVVTGHRPAYYAALTGTALPITREARVLLVQLVSAQITVGGRIVGEFDARVVEELKLCVLGASQLVESPGARSQTHIQ